MTKLELLCLNSCTDDYESIETIAADIKTALPGSVSKDQLIESVQKLVQHGFLMIYRLGEGGAFKQISLQDVNDLKKEWFYITQSGRIELERNWDSNQG